MSKVFIQEETLTNIGSAIREMTGKTDLIAPGDMPAEIRSIETGGGGDLPEEMFIVSGNCAYRFSNNGWNWYLDAFGDKIKTNNITSCEQMFSNSSGGFEEIPFEINCSPGVDVPLTSMFFLTDIKTAPVIKECRVKQMSGLFQYCYNLKTVPDDFCSTWDWEYLDTLTSAYAGNQNNIFNGCHGLRSFPMKLFEHGNPYITYSYSIFQKTFSDCYMLDEIRGFPNPHILGTYTQSGYSGLISADFVKNCWRLKAFTFKQYDSQFNWANQTLDLTTAGFANHVISLDSPEVKDDITYAEYKEHPDWWTQNVAYSRYNHDSAVETINSLPNCINCATANGMNIIKFNGAAGSATDGGAINTLTEDEIAVATAKGWTVQIV